MTDQLPFREFVNALPDRQLTSMVLEIAYRAMTERHEHYVGEPLPPELFVISMDGAIGGASIFGQCGITLGLLTWAFRYRPSVDWPHELGPYPAPQGPMHVFVPIVWAALHEYHHALRKHSDILIRLGPTPATVKATEMDADLCAVAAVYRIFQACESQLDDLSLRMLILYFIHEFLIGIPTALESDSHPAHATRIRQLADKLAQIAEKPDPNSLVADEKLEWRETIERLDYLRPFTAMLLARSHKNAAGSVEANEINQAWQELREHVRRESGTKA